MNPPVAIRYSSPQSDNLEFIRWKRLMDSKFTLSLKSKYPSNKFIYLIAISMIDTETK